MWTKHVSYISANILWYFYAFVQSKRRKKYIRHLEVVIIIIIIIIIINNNNIIRVKESKAIHFLIYSRDIFRALLMALWGRTTHKELFFNLTKFFSTWWPSERSVSCWCGVNFSSRSVWCDCQWSVFLLSSVNIGIDKYSHRNRCPWCWCTAFHHNSAPRTRLGPLNSHVLEHK